MSRLASPEGNLIAQGIGVLVVLGSGLIFMVMKILRELVPWIIAPLMRRRYTEWYAWQFRFVPNRAKWDEDVIFDSLVILPEKYIHDSGFACMDFVAILDEKPIYRLSGCSDVIHINGIGGYGKRSSHWHRNEVVPAIDWSMDCLPKSKLLRLFAHTKLIAGPALSSFEVFVNEDNKAN